jgi:hypothetical protein
VSDWYSLRTQARQEIFAQFSVRGVYSDQAVAGGVPISVNWHSRYGLPVGDIAGGDYSGVLETIDRLIFSRAELDANGLTLRRGGKVELVDYQYTFTLDVREPNAGPVRETWTVAN